MVKQQELYEKLKADGFSDLPDYEKFQSALQDKGKREQLHAALLRHYSDIPDFERFDKALGSRDMTFGENVQHIGKKIGNTMQAAGKAFAEGGERTAEGLFGAVGRVLPGEDPFERMAEASKAERAAQATLPNGGQTYRPVNTFEGAGQKIMSGDVLGGIGEGIGATIETGAGSLAGMATTATPVVGVAAFGVSQMQQFAEERAKNSGRDKPGAMDYVVAAPAAAISAALERIGIGGLNAAPMRKYVTDSLQRRLGVNAVNTLAKAAIEGGTEAQQQIVQYTAEILGTQKDFDLGEAGRQALVAAAGGAGVGGMIGGSMSVMQKPETVRTDAGGQEIAQVIDQQVNQADLQTQERLMGIGQPQPQVRPAPVPRESMAEKLAKRGVVLNGGARQFDQAVIQQESSGNPNAVNELSGATGQYQIMPIFLKEGNRLLGSNYSMQDMKNPAKAEQVKNAVHGLWVRQFQRRNGRLPDAAEMAMMHHGGPEGYLRPNAKDAHGISNAEYARQVVSRMGQTGGVPQSVQPEQQMRDEPSQAGMLPDMPQESKQQAQEEITEPEPIIQSPTASERLEADFVEPQPIANEQAAIQEQVQEAKAAEAAQSGLPTQPQGEIQDKEPAQEQTAVSKKHAESFRSAATTMQVRIDELRNPGVSRQNPTARRANIAASMGIEADRLEKHQQALNGIANDIEAGTLSPALSGIKTKAQVEELHPGEAKEWRVARPWVRKGDVLSVLSAIKGKPGVVGLRDHLSAFLKARYMDDHIAVIKSREDLAAIESLLKIAKKHDHKEEWAARNLTERVSSAKRLFSAGITDEASYTSAKEAIDAYVKGPSREMTKAKEIKAAEDKLIGTKIPGFFPTPKRVVAGLLEQADIKPVMKVLEPSAGKGDIAEMIREQHPDAKLSTVEFAPSLADLLRKKGFDVDEGDFMDHSGSYDRIVMNPPFENGADGDHVRHAYELLKPGGRLVSIMGEGTFSRIDKKAVGFREWLDSVGGLSEKLPDGSFTGADSFRQTGTATRRVVIDKSENQTPDSPDKSSSRTEPSTVAGKIEQQLEDAGMYTEGQRKAAGVFVQAFYDAKGKQLGVSPESLYKVHPYRIEGGNVRGDVLEQKAEKLPETIEIDGKQRPTTNSEGKPIHPTEEGVRNFWKWFGDSEVVDEQGRPKVVYHGTSGERSVFEPYWKQLERDAMPNELKGNGSIAQMYRLAKEEPEMHFFATEQGTAESYGPDVVEAYLKIDNLLGSPDAPRDNTIQDMLDGDADGAVFSDTNSSGRYGGEAYVVRDSRQIKSATGNSGAFSPADANILRQLSGKWYYSALQRAFESAKQSSMPGNQWAQWLASNANKLGVKSDEIRWSGLGDWLVLRGKEKVTKREIVDYLRQNGVQVKEVMKGEESDAYREKVKRIERLRDTAGQISHKEAERRIQAVREEFGVSDTKYEVYVEKGGKNYRELLLTLPGNRLDAESAGERYYDTFVRKGGEPSWSELPAERKDEIVSSMPKEASAPKAMFRSSHWDEPNVLAHIRFNDRTDADGNKVLFVEEIQSDWGQEGKKKGFDKNTPSAPFVTDTKAWVSLALKRMIRYAAENGYDKVAFVNGEQSAERYDLSKQVDGIQIQPSSNPDKVHVFVKQKGEKEYQRIGDSSSVEKAKLPDVLGKELAQKALADIERNPDGVHEYEGLDLKVGGEGMRTFYDKIVPQVAGSIVKKYGATLSPANVGTDTDQITFDVTPQMREAAMSGMPLFQKGEGETLAGFDPARLTAILTEKATFASFLHETGHAYLDMTAAIASQKGAPKQIKFDMDILLRWFGVGGLAAWNAMNLNQKRKYHEQFAYNFEIYLSEGKAPSVGLKGVFDRFKQWLKDVYRDIKTQVNAAYRAETGEDLPGLTDEVRGVMDRLLADKPYRKPKESKTVKSDDAKSEESYSETFAEDAKLGKPGASTYAGEGELKKKTFKEHAGLKGREIVIEKESGERPRYKTPYYEVIPNAQTVEEAVELSIDRTIDEIEAAIRDRSVLIAPHVRVALAELTLKRLSEQYRKTKDAGILERQNDLADFITDYAEETGRTLQAFSLYKSLTPEGVLVAYNRVKRKAEKAHYEKNQPDVDDVIGAVGKGDKEQKSRKLKDLLRQRNRVARKIRPLFERIVEASELGVFGKQEFYDIVGPKLGLPEYSEDVARRLMELTEAVQLAPEGIPQEKAIAELHRFIAKHVGFGVQDLPLGIYYGNILSGYMTHTVNIADTFANVVSEVNNLAISNPKAAAFVYAQFIRGFNEGRYDAVLAWSEGRRLSDGKWYEGARFMDIAEFGKKGGVPIIKKSALSRYVKVLAESKAATPLNMWKYVTRLLTAEDALMWRPAHEARAALLAFKLAEEQGLKGSALIDRASSILNLRDITPYVDQAKREGFAGQEAMARAVELRDMLRPAILNEDAKEWAGDATYNHTPRGLLGLVAKQTQILTNKIPPLKFLVPFTQIVANVTNRGLNWTPYGFKRAYYGHFFGDPLNAEQRQAMLVRATVGTSALVGVAALNALGAIVLHGHGPEDDKERYQMMNGGWIPYSVEIDGKYISYANTPIGLGLAVLGNAIDMQRYGTGDDESTGNRLAMAVLMIGNTVFSQSFLSGLSGFFEALTSDNPGQAMAAWKSLVSRTVSGLSTPNALRDTYRFFDPKAYRASSFMEAIVKNTPFAASAGLKPALNALGQPIYPLGAGATAAQRNRFFGVKSGDPVWRYVMDSGIRISVPSATTEIDLQNDIRMTPDQYYEYHKEQGQDLYRYIEQNLSRLKEMEKEDAEEVVNNYGKRNRKRILSRMRREFQQIEAALK